MATPAVHLLDAMEVRKYYPNMWHTDLLRAPAADFPFFCFSVWCAPCASYFLRHQALHYDLSRYTCCGGYMPFSGACGERSCPGLCLCLEVWLCFPNSVQATRFLIQDEYSIQNTKCDNCIIGLMFCLQQFACICSLIANIVGTDAMLDLANLIYWLANGVYCTVCACMQTQHNVELDKWEGKYGPIQRPTQPPHTQIMSRFDLPIPPSAGIRPIYQPPPPPPMPPPYPPMPIYMSPSPPIPFSYPPVVIPIANVVQPMNPSQVYPPPIETIVRPPSHPPV